MKDLVLQVVRFIHHVLFSHYENRSIQGHMDYVRGSVPRINKFSGVLWTLDLAEQPDSEHVQYVAEGLITQNNITIIESWIKLHIAFLQAGFPRGS